MAACMSLPCLPISAVWTALDAGAAAARVQQRISGERQCQVIHGRESGGGGGGGGGAGKVGKLHGLYVAPFSNIAGMDIFSMASYADVDASSLILCARRGNHLTIVALAHPTSMMQLALAGVML